MGEAFTIEFSPGLLKQLADDGDKTQKKTRRPKPRTPREPRTPKENANRKPISTNSDTTTVSPTMSWPAQIPVFFPGSAPPPSTTYAELEKIRDTVRESEKVLEKLKKEEEFMVEQVTKRAKDLHEKEFKLPEHKTPPCLAEKSACYDCYNENAKNPLRCSVLVETYASCVRRGIKGLNPADK